MKSVLRKISREFNHFRFPECRAKVIEKGEKSIRVEFTGTAASFSCCFDEHFEDFRLVMEERGMKTDIGEIKRESPAKFIVLYVMHE